MSVVEADKFQGLIQNSRPTSAVPGSDVQKQAVWGVPLHSGSSWPLRQFSYCKKQGGWITLRTGPCERTNVGDASGALHGLRWVSWSPEKHQTWHMHVC